MCSKKCSPQVKIAPTSILVAIYDLTTDRFHLLHLCERPFPGGSNTGPFRYASVNHCTEGSKTLGGVRGQLKRFRKVFGVDDCQIFIDEAFVVDGPAIVQVVPRERVSIPLHKNPLKWWLGPTIKQRSELKKLIRS